MSSRQIRRLQNIVKASTGADADEDDYYPVTMKLTRSSKKSKGRRERVGEACSGGCHEDSETQQVGLNTDGAGISLQPSQPLNVSTESSALVIEPRVEQKPTTKAIKEKDEKTKGKKDLSCTKSQKRQQQQVMDREQRSRVRERGNRPKRREEEIEEELLLDAALREREKDVTDGDMQYNAMDGARESNDLLELLSLCNPKMLNNRLERIKRFGTSAVEDVGDGRVPSRRADGRPASQLFEEHSHHLPRFRHSLFVTPNRYCWPHYDSLGVRMTVMEPKAVSHLGGGGGDDGASVYYLDVSSAEARRADANLEKCSMESHSVESLMTCFGKAPYHIPTLIVVGSMFETMGKSQCAYEVMDIALYHVGVLLSRFPIRKTARQRRVPFVISSNGPLFYVLRHGIHHALMKAATVTAWELSKLLFSLDSKDPLGMLLLLDYLALRAKGWAWLVHVYYLVLLGPRQKPDGIAASATAWPTANENVNLPNRELVSLLSTLPGFFFSAALAKHFLDREHVLQAKGGKPSKVVRSMTQMELHAFQNTPSATVMLADAIGRFPSAAVLLIEKNCRQALRNSVPGVWEEVVREHVNNKREGDLHVSKLWVARNAEIWNTADTGAFLERVITEEDGVYLKSHSIPAFTLRADALIPPEYMVLKEEDLLGKVIVPLPEHLTDFGDQMEEDMWDETLRASWRELRPLEEDTLLRFTALYGELPSVVGTPAEQFRAYEDMFEADGHEQRFLQRQNLLLLFLRTLLPQSSTRDMALLEALRAAGIPDPVAERNRLRRQEERLEEEEDVDCSTEGETEDSWESDGLYYDGPDEEEMEEVGET
uniref:Uncharacterized protein n=1 Tax=Trypanosoma congolense (strain IL3000) TaxID=1068625 RepID=G0UU40_TRYCI|nr:conserved hypothetical protein [Trypanosoma congolense IL3000]